MWSEEDKMLGFLESVSNSDSDSLPGCLILLLPPYSCNSTGERVTPQEALVRTGLLHLTRTWAEGQVSIPATQCPCGTFQEGKLCVHSLPRQGWQTRDYLTFRPLTCSPGVKGHYWKTPLTLCLYEIAFLHQKTQIIWQSLRLTVFVQALLGTLEGPGHPSALLNLHN